MYVGYGGCGRLVIGQGGPSTNHKQTKYQTKPNPSSTQAGPSLINPPYCAWRFVGNHDAWNVAFPDMRSMYHVMQMNMGTYVSACERVCTYVVGVVLVWSYVCLSLCLEGERRAGKASRADARG